MSVIPRCYLIIIYHSISAPRHGKDVVYGLNGIDKIYLYQFKSNVQQTGSKLFNSQIPIHSCTQINDISLAK